MSDKQKSEITAETVIVPQLASDQKDLEKGQIDVRRLTRLEDMIEITFHAFAQVVPDAFGGGALRAISNQTLNLKISERGLGRKEGILAIAGSKGVPVMREVDTRSFTQRHVTMRDKEKARQEGKIGMEV